MLFVWGSESRDECQGFVADFCDICRQPRSFEIQAHFKTSHVYYIPLGRGTLQGMTRRCLACANGFTYEPYRYASVLHPSVAAGHPFEALLRNTNPTLWQRLNATVAPAVVDVAREQKAVGGEPPSAMGLAAAIPGAMSDASTPDTRGQDALRRLTQVDTDGEAAGRLGQRLVAWPGLDEAARDALLREVDEHIRTHVQVANAKAFLFGVVGMRPSSDVGCLVVCGFFVIWMFALLFMDLALEGLGVGESSVTRGMWGMLASLALAMYATYRLQAGSATRLYKQWFKTTFLPAAERNGVDVALLLGVMMAYAPRLKGGQQLNPDMAAVIGHLSELISVLAESGQHAAAQAPTPRNA